MPAATRSRTSGKTRKAVARAPLDHAGDHAYIPPVALSVSCLLAIVCPFCVAVIVTCHVPPDPRSPRPS